jgi:hypothetical protein
MKGTTVLRSALLLLVCGLLLGASGAGPVTDDGRVQGKPDAPLTLIEYSDFTCGYCRLPRLSAIRSRCRRRGRGGSPLRRSAGALLGHA